MPDESVRFSVLGSGDLPRDWDRGELERLVPGQGEHVAELKAAEPGYAAFYERGVRGLDSAATAAELKERMTVLLGRERGRVSKQLEALPTVAVELRKRYGRSLNLMKQ